MERIPVMAPSLTGAEKDYLVDAIESSWIGGAGPYITRVEQLWAELCNVDECVSVCNGTVALQLALLALGVGPGDEVIVPALTYVATANAVRHVGAEPVFVDVEPDTWCLDPEQVEQAITRRTKGIMPVHLFGHPADMDRINRIAQLYKLWTLADAAQGHLAKYKGQDVGTLADITTYSFHVGKVFTCGEGGAIVLNDSKLAQWMRFMRGHGMDPERQFFHPVSAFNFRLTNMQSAVLCGQLERREEIFSQRRNNFGRYLSHLQGVPGIWFRPVAEWAETCPWVFCVTIDESEFGMSRDQLIGTLAANNIESRPFSIPLNTLPPFREQSRSRGDHCPVAEQLGQVGMYLPSSTDIAAEEIDRVCDVVQSAARRKAAA